MKKTTGIEPGRVDLVIIYLTTSTTNDYYRNVLKVKHKVSIKVGFAHQNIEILSTGFYVPNESEGDKTC